MDPLLVIGLLFLGGLVLYWLLGLLWAGLLWAFGMTPYLVFLFVPIVVLSLTLGVLWAWACIWLNDGPDENPSSSSTSSTHHHRKRFRLPEAEADFRIVTLLIVVCVLAALLIVKIPMPHEVVMQGKQQVSLIQMPRVYHLFQRFDSWWLETFPSLLKKRVSGDTFFDRNDLSVSVWIALLLGAPSVFLWVSKGFKEHERKKQQTYLEASIREVEAETEKAKKNAAQEVKKAHELADQFWKSFRREEEKMWW